VRRMLQGRCGAYRDIGRGVGHGRCSTSRATGGAKPACCPSQGKQGYDACSAKERYGASSHRNHNTVQSILESMPGMVAWWHVGRVSGGAGQDALDRHDPGTTSAGGSIQVGRRYSTSGSGSSAAGDADTTRC
jgi:hypothetical protein